MSWRNWILGFGASLLACSPTIGHEALLAGYIEKVVLFPGALEIHAKLDTGARSSSINATDSDYYEKNGQKWVRFSVTNRDGRSVRFESPIVRNAEIKRSGVDIDQRPVIRLGICLGNHFREVEVNLNDRTGMNYQMLLGRTFMRDGILIDPGKQYLTSPGCDSERRQ